MPANDFSTDYWREKRRSLPRALAYGLALLVLGPTIPMIFSERFLLVRDYHLVLSLGCNLAFLSVVPALVAKNASLTGRLESLRAQLLALPVGKQRAAALRAHFAMLAAVLRGPAIVLLALLPALALTLRYYYAGYLHHSGVGVGMLLGATWGQALTSLLLGAAIAGLFPWFRYRRARFPLAAVAFSALALRMTLVFFGCEALRPNLLWSLISPQDAFLPPPESAAMLIVWIDMPLTLLGALLLAVVGGLWYRAALREPLPAERSDVQLLDAGGQGLGLEVSFWSLLRWKFWRDPLYRAEHRNLWSRRRRLSCWGLTFLFCGAYLYLWLQMLSLTAGRDATITSMVPLYYFWMAIFLPPVIAPLLMILGAARDRKTRCLESLRLTPVAPVRLAAAKLLGRLSPLIAATGVACLVCAIISYYCNSAVEDVARASYVWSGRFVNRGRLISPWLLRSVSQEYSYFSILAVPTLPVVTLATGAAGLFFGARFRSKLLALTGTVLTSFLCGLLFAVTCAAVIHLVRGAQLTPFYYGVMWGAFAVLTAGVLLRVFISETARTIALRDI